MIPLPPVAGLVEVEGLLELVLVFAGGGGLEVTGWTGGEDVTGLGGLLV